MTIYVDTNILPRWGTLAAPHLAALLAVARTTDHRLVLPALVVEESVSARRRDAAAAFEALGGAHKRASRYSDMVTTYIPSADDVAAEWRDELMGSFEVIEVPAEAASEALRREANRQMPAREGRGGRDAAIWLTALREGVPDGDICHFLSENTADFADPSEKTNLHPSLLSESEEAGKSINYHASIDSLLGQLATPLRVTVSSEELLANSIVIDALRRAVDFDVLPRLNIKRADSGTQVTGEIYATAIIEASSVRAKQSRAYEIEGQGYVLIFFDAELVTTVGVFTRRKGNPLETIVPITLSISGRAWLTLDESSEAVVDAEIPYIDRVEAATPGAEFAPILSR